jgi:hypothetical protein
MRQEHYIFQRAQVCQNILILLKLKENICVGIGSVSSASEFRCALMRTPSSICRWRKLDNHWLPPFHYERLFLNLHPALTPLDISGILNCRFTPTAVNAMAVMQHKVMYCYWLTLRERECEERQCLLPFDDCQCELVICNLKLIRLNAV